MSVLKRCPFCGGKAKYYDAGEPGEFHDFGIECKKCGIAFIPPAEPGCIVPTKSEAKAAWNKRITEREDAYEKDPGPVEAGR